MRSTSGSVLEERLAALVEERSVAHPWTAELVEGGPVLDGAAAMGVVPLPPLPPEACLDGVTDAEALGWAELSPGAGLLAAVEDLWREVADDVDAACCPVAEENAEGVGSSLDEAPLPIPDAVLLEAVAACDRQIAALSARRDAFAGVFAARRQAEAQQDLADARAATAADGVGRPWATRARSTGPSELAARLGIGDSAADALVERGLAAVGPHRAVAEAMAGGALQTDAGSWLLEELWQVHGTSFSGALEREVAAREAEVEARRADEDAARESRGAPPLTRAEVRARAAADREQVEREAGAAATKHADQVTARVRRELLERATGAADWSQGRPRPGSGLAETSAETTGGEGQDGGAPDRAPRASTRPTAGAGLGPTRRSWKRRLALAVRRADASAAEVRAAKARAACSTQRWNEDDDQAALLLRGPVEVIARITAAMDARARRRQSDARAAERVAASEEGRPFDRGAVGSLDEHRIAALEEWATAALELSETSGVSGTWHPIARTAASKPSVHLVLPWTVLAAVSTVGAELAGYGPVGAAAALRIAADGLWRRVFADPTTGAAVGVEEGTWRPSTALARLVSLRWRGSTLPGSTRPVGRDSGPGGGAGGAGGGGQLDHVEPWDTDDRGRPSGGPTEATNLQLLAQVEHLLKQAGEHARPGHGWSVAVDRTGPPPDDGSPPPPSPGDGVVWTSPTGHTYRVSPQRLLHPAAGPGVRAGAADDDASGDEAGGDHAGGAGSGLPLWVHHLLADVLPAWVGWPGGGPAPEGEAPMWSTGWAQSWADPAPAPETDDGDDLGDEPCLFDDLPAA